MDAAFRDPAVEPTTARIHAVLGAAAGAWEELQRLLVASGLAVAWKYYRDGGWLARASRGSKTIAWLNVADGHARITFYFAERHRAALGDDPSLDSRLRERVIATTLVGRLLPVTIDVRSTHDLGDVGAVLRTKLDTA